MNPGIYQGIAPIILAPQTLLITDTKEVVADTELGGASVYRTPWQVIRTGVNRSTSGNIHNDVSLVEQSSPVMIVIVGT